MKFRNCRNCRYPLNSNWIVEIKFDLSLSYTRAWNVKLYFGENMWEKKFAKIKHWNKKDIFSFTDWLLRISSKIVIKRKVDACMVSRAKLSFEAQNNAIETFLTTSNFYFWIRTNNLLNAKKKLCEKKRKTSFRMFCYATK